MNAMDFLRKAKKYSEIEILSLKFAELWNSFEWTQNWNEILKTVSFSSFSSFSLTFLPSHSINLRYMFCNLNKQSNTSGPGGSSSF
jgi:hypothetical protein